jgi:hypothetical protein
LGNCSARNILRELAKKTDQSKVEALENEKAQLAAQVEAMTRELTQKNEEIRRYKAEQTVVLSKVRELVGHPGEVVNKAHLYDQLLESADPASTRQTLQIMVKYSRTMKDFFKEIQKILLPRGTPKRILDPGPPGSTTATLYEAIAEVEIVPAVQTGAGPSQLAGTSGPQESGRPPEQEKTLVPEPTRSTQVRRKSTERSARSSRGQSPSGARPSTRSRTPERARTLDRTRTPKRAKIPDRGKAPMAQASPAPGPDCMILEQQVAPPSLATTARERRTASISCGRNREEVAESDHSPRRSSRKKKNVLVARRSGSGDGSGEDSSAETDEELALSPNVRRAFTRLQEISFLTLGRGVSAISGPASHSKEGTASKKHRTT